MGSQLTKPNSTRLLSLSVALVLALLPFHALFTTWAGANLGHINTWRLWPEALIIWVALPLACWQLLADPKLRLWLKRSRLVQLYLAYLLTSVLLAAWSYRQGYVSKTALALGLDLNLRFIGFFLICQLAAASDDFLRRWWARLAIWPLTGVVVFGLLQKFVLSLNFLSHFGYGSKTIPAYQTVDATSGPARLQSTLRGPNPLGAYLVLGLPLWQAVRSKQKLLTYFGLAAGGIVLFYSYSRSALAAAVMACAGLAWWQAGPRHRRWLLGGLAIGGLLLASLIYADRNSHFVQESLLHTSSSSTSADSSNGVRKVVLNNGWHDLLNQPLGRGPGTAGPASAHNQPHAARIAENYFIQLGQEVGWAGLAIFVAINCLVAVQLWARRTDLLCKILLLSLLGITIVNMLSHAWTDDSLSFLWWGLAGIALAPNLAKNKNKA